MVSIMSVVVLAMSTVITAICRKTVVLENPFPDAPET